MADTGNTKVNIGPLLSFEAHNLGEELKKRNLPHEIISHVPEEIPEVSFAGMIANPIDRSLYIVMARTDYETHRDIFKEIGVELFEPQDSPIELQDAKTSEPRREKASWSFQDTKVVAPVLVLLALDLCNAPEVSVPKIYKLLLALLLIIVCVDFRSISNIAFLLTLSIDVFKIPVPAPYKIMAYVLVFVLLVLDFLKDRKQKSLKQNKENNVL